MPTSANKKKHGTRYTAAQKEEILRIYLASEDPQKALKDALGEGVPNLSTINRWIINTPKTELEKLKPHRYQNEHLENQTERRIKRGKMVEDPSSLSMRSLYLCFYRAYSLKNSDGEDGDQGKRFDCSTYSRFLRYILKNRNITVSINYLQKQLSQHPCSQRAQNVFGSVNCLDKTVYQQIEELIMKVDCAFVQEDLRRRAVLAQELKTCISATADLSQDEKKYIQLSIDIYEKTGQSAYLVSGVIGILNYIIYGKEALFADIRLDRNVIETINRMCVPHEYVSEYLTAALTVGIDGRMGRHELLQLVKRHENINPLAAYELGESFYNAMDYDSAYHYYSIASERGHAVAAWSCGYMLANNRGTICSTFPSKEARFKKAYEYFVIGRELGSTAALHAIGQLYMRGQMVNDHMEFDNPDFEKAKECFYEAIEKKYFYSHNALGWIFEKQANACKDDKERFRLYQAAFNQYEQASIYSDGYSRNKLGMFWENGLGRTRSKSKAAAYYLYALSVLEADIEPWTYYNAGRVFCGRVSSEDELHDKELGIHEKLPNPEKAKFYLVKAAAFMEQQCNNTKDIDGDLLLKYLDCVLQLTKQNIAAVDKNYFELLSIVQKALDCADQWLLFVENSESSLKNNRQAIPEIKHKYKFILNNAKQIEIDARGIMDAPSSFSLSDTYND